MYHILFYKEFMSHQKSIKHFFLLIYKIQENISQVKFAS